MSELVKGQEIFVNSKWWFDILSNENGIVTCSVEYKESLESKKTFYKKLKIAVDKLSKKGNGEWTIDEKWLRKEYGSLVDRLIKSNNVYTLFEDVAGMGAVSMAGLSGSPGVPGSAGSGDIGSGISGGSLFPKGTYGIENLSKNIKTLKRLAKKGKNNKMGIKTPLLNIFKESTVLVLTDSENDFKRKLFDFLDYPWDNDFDCSMICVMNEYRDDYIKISSERILQYIKDIWQLNVNFIKKNCSEEFLNNFLIIGNIEN